MFLMMKEAPANISLRLSRLAQLLRRFGVAKAGVAAIEFAFILPVMVLLYVYLVEFSRAFDEKRKVDRLASTITDLVSQQTTGKPVASATIASIIGASGPLMSPVSASDVQATVSVIELTTRFDLTCCDARVKWSFTQGGLLRPCNTVLSQVSDSTPAQTNNILGAVVGTLFNSKPGELVVADVQANFRPLFNGTLNFFSQGFHSTNYVSPRNTGKLVLQSPASPTSGQQAQICS